MGEANYILFLFLAQANIFTKEKTFTFMGLKHFLSEKVVI